ncbi:mersacidin/lichenicidin family type 2 lantibiotic [Kyrpidia tusciae]|uniref:mersacidin/lichenicidin family type 2 lantibiotic n=1 Tax=Kyrpidia tusciae TaxID=33943 RepID=UPI0002FB0F96|nr:mersacidin/lichenicidin family type 2 lantibiotic [Kyrpidia tusciae]
MTREEIIRAWKSPEQRAAVALAAHPSGAAMSELDEIALQEVIGRGDVQAESTPLCAFGVGFLVGAGIGVLVSVAKC